MNHPSLGSERNPHDSFEHAPVGIFQSTVEGRLIHANEKLSAIFGYASRQRLLAAGQDIARQFYATPSERQRIVHEVLALEPWQYLERELKMRHRDGSPVYIILRMRAVRDAHGKVRHLEGFIEDLTERKRAESALRRSEEMHRIFFESGAVGMVYLGLDGRFLKVNDRYCNITGYSRRALREKTIFDLSHPEDRGQVRRHFAAYVRGKHQTFASERRYLGHHGEVRWVAVTARMVLGADGQPSYSIGIVEDITERKLAVAALLRAQQELQLANRSQAASNQELKLRNRQLASLTRQLQESNHQLEARVAERTAQLRTLALELTQAEERERSRIAKILHDELQQLLVGAKLHLASLGNRASGLPFRKDLLKVAQIINQAGNLARGLSHELDLCVLREAGLTAALHWLARWMQENHQLKVHVRDLAGVEPAEENLKVLIFHSVRELLFNTVKHAGVKQAAVRLSRPRNGDGQMEILVSDQGKGFDPRQVKASDRTRSGLGLASIHERLQLLGGQMKVKSVPGQGSQFVLCVPLLAPPRSRRKSATRPRKALKPGGRPNRKSQ